MDKENKLQKTPLCLICGKKSKESICEFCQNKIQAEAFYKKKKEEKPEK
jgi:hypothetical protein